jgi:esterase
MKSVCKLSTSIILPPHFNTHENVTPLLVLHSLFGTSKSFKFLSNQRKITKPLVLVDLRNHGKSESNNSMTYDEMTEDILEVFLKKTKKHKLTKKLNLKKINIMGHSMGGKVVMNLCLKYPELIDKSAIVDIAPVDYIKREEWDIPVVLNAMKNINLNQNISRKSVIENLRKQGFPLRMCYFIVSNLEHTKENEWRWKFNLEGISKNIQNIAGFPDKGVVYEKPILFLRGETSFRVEEIYHPTIQRIFPKSEIHTMKNVGQ